jgi:predicted lipoprotein with Yx(FWY)xxD motif
MGMRTLVSIATLLVLAGGAASLGSAASHARPTLASGRSSYGPILFDGKGHALYAFTRDRRGGASRCYGDCASAWPVYYAKAALRAGKGIKQGLIGKVRRSGGKLQVTYNGWPLYYYVGDRRAGQVSCQNVDEFGGTWLVVRPSGRLVR